MREKDVSPNGVLGRIIVDKKPNGCTKCPFCVDGNCSAAGRMLPNVAIEESHIKNGDALPDWCPLIEISREEIYREVNHEYRIEDAKNQFEYYMRIEGVDADRCKPDYDCLASLFEKYHDCNVAENDLWRAIIDDYVKSVSRLDRLGFDGMSDELMRHYGVESIELVSE